MKTKLRKFPKIVSLFLLVCMLLSTCISCTAADTVKQNIKVSADNFEVLRKITVYNARTDLVIMCVEGYFSISNNSSKELQITCKVAEDTYKLNYVYLNEYTLYVIEDISGTVTDPYHYKVHYYFPIPDIDINK